MDDVVFDLGGGGVVGLQCRVQRGSEGVGLALQRDHREVGRFLDAWKVPRVEGLDELLAGVDRLLGVGE